MLKSLVRYILPALTLTAFDPTYAIHIDEIKKRDFNQNDIIEPGIEQKAILEIFEQLSSNQKSQISTPDAFVGGGPGVPIDLFDDNIRQIGLKVSCGVSQNFFLRDQVLDISVVSAGLVGRTGSAASASFTSNNLTDELSWNLKGAATWVTGDPCLTRTDAKGVNGVFLSGYALAPFIEFNGRGSSTNRGTSSLRGGLIAEFQFFQTPIFQTQHLKLEPYLQTDFDFDGAISGVRATWIPYDLDLNLNGFIGANRESKYWWTFNGIGGYRNVDNPGRTGLGTDTEYGWIGFRSGLNFETTPDGTNGFYASVNFEAFFDVVSDENIEKFSAEVGAFLTENKKSSISISYENGTDYFTLQESDQILSSFKVSF